MIDHKNFALNGLFPGLVSHRSVANLGHFEIEIVIEPVVHGGGGFSAPITTSNKYKVKIRISRKGKSWNYETVVNPSMARVVARFSGINIQEPKVVVTSVTKTIESIKAVKK